MDRFTNHDLDPYTMADTIYEQSLALHRQHKGKVAITSKVPLKTRQDLSLAYTPGVAEPCREIAKDKSLVYEYTHKGNTVAVVSDGSAVLGLGNIGPEAAMPVMEGKCVLFKEFAGIDAWPICLGTQDPDEIVKIVTALAPTFGAVNLEDISAPRCFSIEARLQHIGIPVMHDDQHGTSIVIMAALTNALKVLKKKLSNITIVVNGAGSAGLALVRMLTGTGEYQGIVSETAKEVIICDTSGMIYSGRTENMNPFKEQLAGITNLSKKIGNLTEALKGADVFIGLSGPNVVSVDMVKSMAMDSIVFAMANPVPEIMPDLAKQAGAAIVGTGRSDFPNQVNNVLAYPGVFRGALDARAPRITAAMKLAAVKALAGCVEKPIAEHILPTPLDIGVAQTVAQAVRKAAGT